MSNVTVASTADSPLGVILAAVSIGLPVIFLACAVLVLKTNERSRVGRIAEKMGVVAVCLFFISAVTAIVMFVVASAHHEDDVRAAFAEQVGVTFADKDFRSLDTSWETRKQSALLTVDGETRGCDITVVKSTDQRVNLLVTCSNGEPLPRIDG